MQAETRGMLRLVGVAFLIFCFGFLLLSAPFWYQQWNVLHTWPTVDAEVLRSEVISMTVGRKTMYDVLLQFRFRSGDRIFDTLYKSNRFSGSRERKQHEADRFPVGSHIRILHQPGNPAKVRLDPGYNLRFFAIPALLTALGIICALAGSAFFVAAGLGKAEPPPQALTHPTH
jgi:Protein of unknown function (DUF3592)